LKKAVGLVFLILLVGSGYWAWSTLTEVKNREFNSELSLTRRSDANGVIADVVFLTPLGQGSEKELTFRVELNTHSVPLESYDIAGSAVVKSSDGEVRQGFSWQPAGEEATHHRSGLLTASNNGVLGPDTKWLILELQDLAGVPVREFRWEGSDLR